MFVLIGVALVIIGFALRIHALLVVTVAGIVTAAIAGIGPVDILNTFGTGFAGSRSVTTFAIVLPVIGLIERHGLQEQAKQRLRGIPHHDRSGRLARARDRLPRQPGRRLRHRNALRLLRNPHHPVAANFNLVPAALLEMKDKYGPIKAQLPTAGMLLIVNIGVMYFAAF